MYKRQVNVLYQKSLQENPQFASNPLSRWQQKQAIKRQYAAAKHAGQTAGNTAQAASKTGKAARTVKEKVQQAGAFVMRHKKGFLIAGVLFLIACMLMNTMSSCSKMCIRDSKLAERNAGGRYYEQPFGDVWQRKPTGRGYIRTGRPDPTGMELSLIHI